MSTWEISKILGVGFKVEKHIWFSYLSFVNLDQTAIMKLFYDSVTYLIHVVIETPNLEGVTKITWFDLESDPEILLVYCKDFQNIKAVALKKCITAITAKTFCFHNFIVTVLDVR